MDHVESLVRWLVTYSVAGGFWHFAACYLIVVAIARIFRFVRVEVKAPSTPKKGDA